MKKQLQLAVDQFDAHVANLILTDRAVKLAAKRIALSDIEPETATRLLAALNGKRGIKLYRFPVTLQLSERAEMEVLIKAIIIPN